MLPKEFLCIRKTYQPVVPRALSSLEKQRFFPPFFNRFQANFSGTPAPCFLCKNSALATVSLVLKKQHVLLSHEPVYVSSNSAIAWL
jgi:hypothetical protein